MSASHDSRPWLAVAVAVSAITAGCGGTKTDTTATPTPAPVAANPGATPIPMQKSFGNIKVNTRPPTSGPSEVSLLEVLTKNPQPDAVIATVNRVPIRTKQVDAAFRMYRRQLRGQRARERDRVHAEIGDVGQRRDNRRPRAAVRGVHRARARTSRRPDTLGSARRAVRDERRPATR